MREWRYSSTILYLGPGRFNIQRKSVWNPLGGWAESALEPVWKM
jgi:hypothetical protein